MNEILALLACQLSVSGVGGFNSWMRCQEDEQTHKRLIEHQSKF